MEIKNLNLNQTPPPHTHKILWAVVGVFLLIVVVGTYFWWQEIKQTNQADLTAFETLAGIDADKNGIRDDVEKIIRDNYSESAVKQAALSQYAASLQSYVMNTNGNEKLEVFATYCVVYVFGIENSRTIIGPIRDAMLNTPPRLKAYLLTNDRLVALESPNPSIEDLKTYCNFNLDSLDTSTWKTYTNSQYGFSFKYPIEWEIEELTPTFISISSKNDPDNIGGEINYGPSHPIHVQIYDNPKNDNLNDWFDNEYSKNEVFSKKSVRINNMHAIEASVAGMISTESIYLGSQEYIIDFNISSDSPYKHIFDQILSTFKFTK